MEKVILVEADSDETPARDRTPDLMRGYLDQKQGHQVFNQNHTPILDGRMRKAGNP